MQGETMVVQRKQAAMTYEEFLDWADEDTLAEWVDGRVEMTSPANARHQQLGQFVYDIVSRFVAAHNLGALLLPPFQMRLPQSGREPDLLFLSQASLARLRSSFINGPADLVMEIVSPESVTRDYETKLAEYQAGGVPEYWLLDPDTRQAAFYQLDAQGAYQPVAPDARGIYRSRALPGFWLDVAWLWQAPLPDVEDTALRIVGDAYARYLIARLQGQGYLP